jgi:hypothetical protein
LGFAAFAFVGVAFTFTGFAAFRVAGFAAFAFAAFGVAGFTFVDVAPFAFGVAGFALVGFAAVAAGLDAFAPLGRAAGFAAGRLAGVAALAFVGALAFAGALVRAAVAAARDGARAAARAAFVEGVRVAFAMAAFRRAPVGAHRRGAPTRSTRFLHRAVRAARRGGGSVAAGHPRDADGAACSAGVAEVGREARPRRGGVERADPEALQPGALARDELDARRAHAERRRERGARGLGRTPVHGRRLDPDAEGVTVTAAHLGGARTRLHVHTDDRVVAVALDGRAGRAQ